MRPRPLGAGRAGVPVYDEGGVKLAERVADAARQLGVTPPALYYHLRPYADGHQLVSRPNPANTGRRGGAKLGRVLPP